VFWVISVYFNIRNTLPKFCPFLLGHPVYNVIHLVYAVFCVVRAVHKFGFRLVVKEVSIMYGEEDDGGIYIHVFEKDVQSFI
jgi:hypothetical protein